MIDDTMLNEHKSISIDCSDPGCWNIYDKHGSKISLNYEDWDIILKYILDSYNLDPKTRIYSFINSLVSQFCSNCKMDCMECDFYEFSKFIERRISYKKL